ncbi:MAG TPA: DUF3078 domain-containing protein [Chitinophagaceae bacterium]|nr:DUF3078 domain-containing protein [Chitinophagaceae bacterium]
MKKIYWLIYLLTAGAVLFAQDPAIKGIQQEAQKQLPKDTAHKDGWKTGGLISLNIGQGGSRNWAAGAEKFSFSTAAFVNLFANNIHGKWSWNNNLDLAYALVNTTSQGVRKNDDKIDLLSRVGYALGPKLDLSGILSFRTQFANGYEYNYLNKGLQHRISGFFAPAYLTVAPGITWKPAPYFSVFISPISGRWVIVSNDPYSYLYPGGIAPTGELETPLALKYGVDPAQKVKIEMGAFLSANFNKEVAKNVVYISKLELYSNYLKTKRVGDTGDGKARPGNVDVYWTNAFAMKVNKWLNVNYNFDLIYDDDVRQFGPAKNAPGIQLRSLLAVGFAAKF